MLAVLHIQLAHELPYGDFEHASVDMRIVESTWHKQEHTKDLALVCVPNFLTFQLYSSVRKNSSSVT